ncbi:MAG: 4-hydroxybenzoate 3-monooxygenase [Yaniella sp.]|nr:4-hydroxybenzoate 3-monooxygenase [Yaniella sp.]
MSTQAESTQVGIVGGGPAGLMLSHLLSRAGIDNIVLESRDYETIKNTHRAGILETGAVKMLTDYGVDSRVQEMGYEHHGIDLRFDGESHRINFKELIDASVWLYPQNEVFVDLAAARARDKGDVRYEHTVIDLSTVESDTPKIHYTDADGQPGLIEADLIVGTDGSRSFCRRAIPSETRVEHKIEYPFAWFGILTEAPPSAEELIYANSPRGFALISQRNETVQRHYFQCDPNENPDDWTEDEIWAELQARVDGPDGFQLKRGPIFEKTVLKFRSFVAEPMRWGNLFLAGDAGHTVPPTGAKGLNLAFADVKVLFTALEQFFNTGDSTGIDNYSETALKRVWKAQNFSYWMTSMLHTRKDASSFETRRAIGELHTVVGSKYGRQYLAESYCGWPHE